MPYCVLRTKGTRNVAHVQFDVSELRFRSSIFKLFIRIFNFLLVLFSSFLQLLDVAT